MRREEKIEAIIKMHKEGSTAANICATLECSLDYVRDVIRKAGLQKQGRLGGAWHNEEKDPQVAISGIYKQNPLQKAKIILGDRVDERMFRGSLCLFLDGKPSNLYEILRKAGVE